MIRKPSPRTLSAFGLALLLLIGASPAVAQTSAFTYQGKIDVSGTPANGAFDLQFKLFDALAGGNQQGSTLALDEVTVTGGLFTVSLNFGASVFSGANRYLEIGIRPGSDSGPYTVLAPRQAVTATPYAIKSLNAATADGLSVACVGCVTSNQIGSVSGGTVNGAIPVASVPAGSANYIQNGALQQAGASFNISGNGTAGGTLAANIVNATTQYNMGVNRMLSNAGSNNLFVGTNAGINNTGGSNTFVGSGAGIANTSGGGNTFVGNFAGWVNTTGNINSLFGYLAGSANTTGLRNSFFGSSSGAANTTGQDNSLFGAGTGGTNQTGSFNSYFGSTAGYLSTGNNNSLFGYYAGHDSTADNNSFFGYQAGILTTTGGDNAFFGANAGHDNKAGASNAFFGSGAGQANQTASGNSFFGFEAGFSNTSGAENVFSGFQAGRANKTASNNSFFGYKAGAANFDGINNSFFGRNAGDSNNSGNNNSFFGANAGDANFNGNDNAFFGRNAGAPNVTGSSNAFFGAGSGLSNTTGNSNAFFGASAGSSNSTGGNNTLIGANANVGLGNLSFASAIGAGAVVSTNDSLVLGRAADTVQVPGKLVVTTLGAAGSTALCQNGLKQIATCSSSIRYKTHINAFNPGMQLINRLRPVTFNWKATNEPDLGFVAEEVAAVEPLLIIRNPQGEVEGVKYDRIAVLLVNAVKEQQAVINQQQQRSEQQAAQIRFQQQQIEAQQKRFERQQQEIDALKHLARRVVRTAARRPATRRP